MHHRGQSGQRLRPAPQNDAGEPVGPAVGLGQIEQPLAACDGQIDQDLLHVGVADERRAGRER